MTAHCIGRWAMISEAGSASTLTRLYTSACKEAPMQEGCSTPEVWLPVGGFEGRYEVSDLGQFRSLDRRVRTWQSGRVLRGQILKQRDV